MEMNFDKLDGLIPAVIQDAQTSEVLMVGFMNQEAWEKTLQTRKAHFFSRTRNRLWMKGETSGHVQEVERIIIDCDEDSVVLKVRQVGGSACHTGKRSCFYRDEKGEEIDGAA